MAVDPYYSIQEEDEENEEDSFEIVKREARELRQDRFEKGIIERQSGGDIFRDLRVSKVALQAAKEGSENITPESEGMKEEGKQGQLVKLPEMDEDMQNSFDSLLDHSPKVDLSQPTSPDKKAIRKTLVQVISSN